VVLSGSPFSAPFMAQLQAHMAFLTHASDVLHNWIAAQTQWQHLERVFATEELKRQLPGEASKFEHADMLWKQVASAAVRDATYCVVLKLPGRRWPTRLVHSGC
jgi:hypothetical protein